MYSLLSTPLSPSLSLSLLSLSLLIIVQSILSKPTNKCPHTKQKLFNYLRIIHFKIKQPEDSLRATVQLLISRMLYKYHNNLERAVNSAVALQLLLLCTLALCLSLSHSCACALACAGILPKQFLDRHSHTSLPCPPYPPLGLASVSCSIYVHICVYYIWAASPTVI